jgi:predicted nucleic acid-binding protein
VVSVFIDSSGLYSLLDRYEKNHSRAVEVWKELVQGGAVLLTTNYVLLETAALVQRRVGVDAVRALHHDFTPVLTTEWISRGLHTRGIDAALAAARRKLSVVDCISFIVMREQQIETAFTFDAHFAEQGFTAIPSGAISSPA